MPRKRLLALSYLFPNVEKPNHGIFVYNRLNAMAKYADITVINPIPWSPLHFFINKFKHLRNIPVKTQRGNLTIYHPRYLSIPGYAKGIEIPTYWDGNSMCQVIGIKIPTYVLGYWD